MDPKECLHNINREIEFAKIANKNYFILKKEIPSFPSGLTDWTELEGLTIEGYQQEYPNLDQLTSLKKLILKNSFISTQIATLPNLETLEIHDSITGNLGESLVACQQIHHLRFDQITIFPDATHALPKELSEMINLKSLHISGTKDYEIPNLSKLNQLTKLYIDRQAIPQGLGELKKLAHLTIEHSKTNELPTEIENCKELEILDLRLNEFTIIPRFVFELPNLKKIDLLSNPIIELPILSKTCSLKELYLHNIRIKEIPENFISFCLHLEILKISGTDLTDLPIALNTLPHLKKLDVTSLKKMLKKPVVLDQLINTEIIEEYGRNSYHVVEKETDVQNEEEIDQEYDTTDEYPKSYWIHGFVADEKEIILKVESIKWEDYPYPQGDFWTLNRKKNTVTQEYNYAEEIMMYDCGYHRNWFEKEIIGLPLYSIAKWNKKIEHERFYINHAFYNVKKEWKKVELVNPTQWEINKFISSSDYIAVAYAEKTFSQNRNWLVKEYAKGNWSEKKFQIPSDEELIYFEEEKTWGSFIPPDSIKCKINPIKKISKSHSYSGNQRVKILGLNSDKIIMSVFSTHMVNGIFSMILITTNGGKKWELIASSEIEVYNDLLYFEEKILVGSFHRKKEDQGKIYQILVNKKQLTSYIENPLEATFLVSNGSELFAGGGYGNRIYTIQNKKLKGYYEIDFKSQQVEFKTQAEQEKTKDMFFDSSKKNNELLNSATLFFETACWEAASELYIHLYNQEKDPTYAKQIAFCFEKMNQYEKAYQWYEVFDNKHLDADTLIKRAYLSLDLFSDKHTQDILLKLKKLSADKTQLLFIEVALSKSEEEKKRYYEEIIKINPQEHHALKKLAQLFIKEENFEEAEKHLDQYLKIKPKDIEALDDRFQLAENKKDDPKELELIRKLIRIDFLNVKWHEKKLEILKRLKKTKTEIERQQILIYDLRQRVSIYSFAQGWLAKKENFYHVENRLNEALYCIPDSEDFLTLMAHLKILQGKLDEAKKLCEKALHINPAYTTALFHLGVIAWEEGDVIAAEKYYYKVVEDEYNKAPMAYYNLGIIFEGRKEYVKAISYYSQAIQKLAKDFLYMAFNNRAYTFFKLKEYHQAERDVRISLSYNDKNAPAWLTLAAILNIDSKRKKEGEECIQKAFELGVSREEILNDEELGDLRKIIQ